MFDHSFEGATAANKPAERKPVTLKPEQVDALKQESYDAGFEAGRKAGINDQTQRLMGLVTTIGERLTTAIDLMLQQRQQQDQQLHQIVMAVARKILPDFSARHGLQEIDAMLTQAISEMVHEPRIVVRTHDSEFEAINARITEITTQKAYAGKVVVLADPEIALGDCRVEWADGGIERKTEATWSAVEQIITPVTHR
jgi:flagellar assembly protein FliH